LIGERAWSTNSRCEGLHEESMKVLLRDQRGVRELEEGYASELELQEFLSKHTELIPLQEIESGTPPLLCIGFEVNVASGSQDLLYVDMTGMLTIVETKLKRNPEARREVVGQILEYAADTSNWTISDLEERAAKYFSGKDCAAEYSGLSFSEAIERFLSSTHSLPPEGFSYQAFADSISANIERGQIRLIIAVDESPPALLRTVEFVNRFSERFEMFLIQLKRFHDAGANQDIFVPALFGRVPKADRSRAQARLWNAKSFLQQASEQAPAALAVLRRLVEFAENEGSTRWGRGARVATLKLAFAAPDGIEITAFWLMANGKIEISFWKWPEALRAAKEAYRVALRTVEGIPMDAVETETWRDVDVGFLGSDLAWGQFQKAVHALKHALTTTYGNP